MATMCNSCSKPLRGSKYYEVICRDATEHEDREEKIDDLQKEKKDEEESRKAKEHNKMIDELKNALRKLSSQELDEEMLRLSEEIQELKKQLKDLPDEEAKKSKSAMAEYIGIDNSRTYSRIDADDAIDELVTLQRHRNKKLKHGVMPYNVLTLNPYEKESHSGDSLLLRLGSTDEPTKGNGKDDEFLKSLGSVD